MNVKKHLELGCGYSKYRPDALGVDRVKLAGVDIVWDLNEFPWKPLESDTFDEIYTCHCIEHLLPASRMKAMNEIYRVAKDGARIIIRVPHYLSPGSWGSVSHYHCYSEHAFDNYLESDDRSYYDDEVRFKDIKIDYTWTAVGKLAKAIFGEKVQRYLPNACTEIRFEMTVVK